MPEGENRVLAAALYRFGNLSYTQAIAARAARLDAAERDEPGRGRCLGGASATISPCASWNMRLHGGRDRSTRAVTSS